MVEVTIFETLMAVAIVAILFVVNYLSQKIGRDIIRDINEIKSQLETIRRAHEDHVITPEEQNAIIEALTSIAGIVVDYADLLNESGAVVLVVKKLLGKL